MEIPHVAGLLEDKLRRLDEHWTTVIALVFGSGLLELSEIVLAQ